MAQATASTKVQCPSCNTMVSAFAFQCPQCGRKRQNLKISTKSGMFQGRTGLVEYLVWIAITAASVVAFPTLTHLAATHSVPLKLAPVIPGMLVLYMFILYVECQARRLHDVNRTAWNVFWNFTGIGAIYVMILCLQPTKTETNRFGPPTRKAKPKEITEANI